MADHRKRLRALKARTKEIIGLWKFIKSLR
jgi:hypothetical protein